MVLRGSSKESVGVGESEMMIGVLGGVESYGEGIYGRENSYEGLMEIFGG